MKREKREGRTAMQVNLPPDLETLVNKRLSSGGYASVEDVFRRALEAQDAEESWTEEERRALSSHLEEGFLQAERGELIDGAQVRREIQGMKDIASDVSTKGLDFAPAPNSRDPGRSSPPRSEIGRSRRA
jgi:Arc/MetJ-type ribon-helix-helix transcriptional regulator